MVVTSLGTLDPIRLSAQPVRNFFCFLLYGETSNSANSPPETLISFHPSLAMKTTWKDIAPVPTSQEFLDIVLSRTQRRLPTQIRAGFAITRIRGMQRREEHRKLGERNLTWCKLSISARSNTHLRPSARSSRQFWTAFRVFKTSILFVSKSLQRL